VRNRKERKMAYNFQHNKSPQPFGGRGVKQQSDTAGSGRNVAVPAAAASPFRPASSSPLPMAPRMSAPMDSSHAASPGPGVMLRRQLLSPPCGSSSSPQSSPCPSPVTAGGRLRPHSIALASGEGGGGTPQQQLQQFLGKVVCLQFRREEIVSCSFWWLTMTLFFYIPLIYYWQGLALEVTVIFHHAPRFIFIDVDVYSTASAKKDREIRRWILSWNKIHQLWWSMPVWEKTRTKQMKWHHGAHSKRQIS
jgi:hypothetical protein